MNGDSLYYLLLCFVSGFTQCALLGCAVLLLRHHRSYQFQKIFAAVLVLHAFGFFNNFVVAACRHLPCSEFLNLLLIFYDYIIVGAYMMFAVSLVFSNRLRIGQLLMMEIPFMGAMLLFAITRSPVVLPVTRVFTLAASLALLVFLLISIKRYTAMLLDNVGNIEYFDLRWSAYLCILLFVIQLLWAFESVSQQTWFSSPQADKNLLFDTLYCLVTIVFVLFVTRKIVQQKVFSISNEEGESLQPYPNGSMEADTPTDPDIARASYHESLMDKNIETLIRDNRYYLDKALTLQKLASVLGTNRQYLSNYINHKKVMTFYDYINDFRLEEAKALLNEEEHSYTLKEIAVLSGFNSYSTFLRSFAKKYGQTPSQYMKGKQR